MAQLLRNNVSGVLGLELSAVGTSMTLLDASNFPAPTGGDHYFVTLFGLNSNGQEDKWEIVRVTGKASNTLTVTRAQESTTARLWPYGTTVQMRLTAGSVFEIGSGGTGATTASDARTNLGLAIGTNVQAWDADLDSIAGLAGTSGFLKKTAANTWSLDTNNYLIGNQSILLSGDVSGSGATSISVTLNTVAASKGGTGITSYAVGDLLYASGTTALSKLASVAVGSVLLAGGVGSAPSWGKVALGSMVQGALGTSNGGTGATTTQGGINALAGAVTSGHYLRGNGTNVVMSAIQAADVPLLNQNTTGTASNVTGTVAIGNGGTGATTAANARANLDVPTRNGTDATGTWGISITGNAANITGTYGGTLTSTQVTNAIGYTPYNSTNPSGYVTSSGSVSYASNAGGISATGALLGYTYSGTNTSYGAQAGPQIQGQGGGGAVFSLHRPGAYGINIGLDSDNVFRIGGWLASANRLQMDMSGNLTMAGNVTAYSDERLKKDWVELPYDFVERLAQIKHGTFTRIDSNERQVGVSAQSFSGLLPEAVPTDSDGMLSVAYGNAALAACVQLAQRVVELTERVKALEGL